MYSIWLPGKREKLSVLWLDKTRMRALRPTKPSHRRYQQTRTQTLRKNLKSRPDTRVHEPPPIPSAFPVENFQIPPRHTRS